MTATILGETERTNPWVRRVLLLAWFTVAYNLIEGVVAMGFGIADESVALFGFGADSFIEVFSAVVILWRFRGEIGARRDGETRVRERKATLAIGVLFVLLAVATAAGCVLQIASGGRPETTIPSIVIAVISLSFMVTLWRAKLAAAKALGSRAAAADAACSLACMKLSAVLLAGSVVFLLVPELWWADAAAALALAFLVGREGKELIAAARRGDVDHGCCGSC